MKTRHFLAASVAALVAGPAMAQQTVTWWDFLAGGDGVRVAPNNFSVKCIIEGIAGFFEPAKTIRRYYRAVL